MKKVIANQNEICNMQFWLWPASKFRKKLQKKEHSAGVVIFVTHTSSTSALFYKVLVQRLRQQQGKPTLSRNFARQSLFLKTRWCPVQIQIQRTNTRRQNHGKLVTTARDGVMTLRMPVYLRCPATVAGFLTTPHITPFLVKRRIITIDIACFQCDKRSLGGEDICPK